MRRIAGKLGALFIATAMAMPAVAGEEDLVALGTNREEAVSQLLSRLEKCEPKEMQETAYVLGEAKVHAAVIPLMRMLHDGEEECRIVAALALCRIGDARGTYAVKQAVRFDKSEHVQQLAAWFYDQYVKPGTYQFVAVDAAKSAPVADR